jgi:hypothetical protein
MGKNFTVGLGSKRMPLGFKLSANVGIVLDDPV